MKNLTDYFQSLELVKVGIPKETADYYFPKNCEYNTNHKRQEPAFPYIPCWSLGALWDCLHYDIDGEFEFDTTLNSEQLIEALVNAIITAKKKVR